MRKILASKKTVLFVISTLLVTSIIFVLLSLSGNMKLSFLKPANFFKIKNNVLSRSAQPNFFEFFFLKVNGVKSIVNLRENNDDDDQFFINLLGFKNCLNVQITDYSVPSDDQIMSFLKFVTNPENQPVHFHCRSGKGRAGLMEIIYRYSVDGKSIRKSINLTHKHHDIQDTQIEWLLKWVSKNNPGWFSLEQKK